MLVGWSPSKSGANKNGAIFTQLGRHFRQKSELELFLRLRRFLLYRGLLDKAAEFRELCHFSCLFLVSHYKKRK